MLTVHVDCFTYPLLLIFSVNTLIAPPYVQFITSQNDISPTYHQRHMFEKLNVNKLIEIKKQPHYNLFPPQLHIMNVAKCRCWGTETDVNQDGRNVGNFSDRMFVDYASRKKGRPN